MARGTTPRHVRARPCPRDKVLAPAIERFLGESAFLQIRGTQQRRRQLRIHGFHDFKLAVRAAVCQACTRFCHESGGELEQIQFLLAHVSVQTTKKYLGCKQRFRHAVNDRFGIEPPG